MDNLENVPAVQEAKASKMMIALDWAYDKAVGGVPGLDSAEELARDYLQGEGTLMDKVNSLIRWQNTKSATSGFVTGLGGLVAMPITVPANISSVLYVQVRMIAAIAVMGGYDLRDDRVKTMVYVALCGSAVKDLFKNAGIQLCNKLTMAMIQKYLTANVINQINKAVGFRLLTKFGQTGIINAGKAVPLLGGVIGGAFDGVMTNIVGNTARDLFIKDSPLC